jgi:hypothetical protein
MSDTVSPLTYTMLPKLISLLCSGNCVQARSQSCEKRVLVVSVRLCVRMEKLCSQWTDFHEI